MVRSCEWELFFRNFGSAAYKYRSYTYPNIMYFLKSQLLYFGKLEKRAKAIV
ncbi:MAG: hypothetical protein ACRC2V_14365 [Xenococcaceae cyanobacterium]